MQRRSRTIAAIAGAFLLGGSALLVTAPVMAAPLPAGQTITTIDRQPGTTFTADAATAALTVVGPSGVQHLLATDVAEDGQGYAVMGDTATGVQSVLYTFNAVTGAATLPKPITVAGHGNAFACRGLDFSAGVLIAGCLYSANNAQFAVIGILDPATGILAADVLTTNPDPVLALAKSPVDGKIWTFGGLGAIYNADLAAHTYTPVAVVQNNTTIYGADFDRDGQLYVTDALFVPANPDPVVVWQLGTMNPAAGTVTLIGQLTGNDRTEALTIWGEVPLGGEDPANPPLPATGPADDPWIAAGALAILVGIVALAIVRRRSAPA